MTATKVDTDTTLIKDNFMYKHHLWGVLFGAVIGGGLYYVRSNSFMTGKIMYGIIAALAAFLVFELCFGAFAFLGIHTDELYTAFLTAFALFFGLSCVYHSSSDMSY